MGMNNWKTLSRTSVGIMITALLVVGCNTSSTAPEEPADGNAGTGAAEQTNEKAPEAAEEVGYPDEITYWVQLNANVAATMKDYGEIAAYKKVAELTGTKVTFQHPPVGQEKDQFNLMIASGELPDVIEYPWAAAPKGADSLIKEGRILRLNELIAEHAPNLTKILDENPDYRKMVTTDEGNIYVMPFIMGDPSLSVVHGPIVREDWLKKLGLEQPTTIAEWEAMLTAFRDGDPNGNGQKDEIPFLFNINDIDLDHLFVGAWGITQDFYQENGTVKYGPIQPEFKEYLATLAKWYKDGLIDPDFATTDGKLKDAKVTGNQLGAFTGYPGSSIGRYIDLMKENPEFSLVGPVYPALEEGGYAMGNYSYPFSGIGAAVSATADNPEQIVKWLDYKYSEEGHFLFNFGIEGESYTMVDGYPTYTDVILKNPDGLPITQAMAKYFTANWSGPFIQDKRYMEQYYQLDQQKQANQNWSQADHSKHLPPLTLTADESSKTASIMNDVKTYRDEMINRFIMGAEPIDNFDKFVSTIENMGIQEAIAARQAALERYNARK
ncbi:extracellular solute-binding protein [Paenibacillus antri]